MVVSSGGGEPYTHIPYISLGKKRVLRCKSMNDSIAMLTFFFPDAPFVHSPEPFCYRLPWARTLNRKNSDVQTIPGQMGHCLHEEIEEISTLLARPTRVSRRVTRQGGLTRLDCCFHVNASKHLTAKGLPSAVTQPEVKRNPGSWKEALN